MTEITEDLIRRQIRPRSVMTGSLALVTALSSGMPYMESTPTEQSINMIVISNILFDERVVERITQRAHLIAENPLLRDEDEPPPALAVLERFEYMVRRAASLMRNAMQPGQVVSFDGELSVTWRIRDRLVKLICFPDNSSTVQLGSLALPAIPFSSTDNPTPDFLAEKLDSLVAEDDVEGPPFLG